MTTLYSFFDYVIYKKKCSEQDCPVTRIRLCCDGIKDSSHDQYDQTIFKFY